MPDDLDLTPDPRVLQMLGEINLAQWRCLAELIDNSIDGFNAAANSGAPIESPEVLVSLPTSDNEHARVSIKDNGPGMTAERLENALKAGWTGNNPFNNLGLFGMGFNIATARLGFVTEVWTTQAGDAEAIGVRIDLNELRASGKYKVPRQVRPKADPADHYTEIVISRLKPDQRAYLARGNNQRTIRTHLARTYSAILGTQDPVRLKVNATRIVPQRHCIWSPERPVSLPDGTLVSTVEQFDFELAPRRYCVGCMRVLAADEATCPTGSPKCTVVENQRRLHGWIGLQRYLDESDFGIDFIRNGRKIEIGNKDLFDYVVDGRAEREYPIDDPRNRGRFVGEIHLDHCRVSYTKDRFERDDPAWAEMVRLVRGDGPLRPQVAKQQGFSSENKSPLYRLFQNFRRSSPQGKNALWSRVLVVKNNDRARQMADLFAAGDPDYITDDKWWEIVQEQDKDILEKGVDKGTPPLVPDDFNDQGGAGGSGDEQGGQASPAPDSTPESEAPPAPVRTPLHELTRKYSHSTYRVEFDVQALAVASGDPDLAADTPWLLRIDDVSTRTYGFLVDTQHEVFRSTTLTPLDALLTELTHRTLDFLKDQTQGVTLAAVLADFRRQYCLESRLDPQEIIAFASSSLADLGRIMCSRIPTGEGEKLYGEFDETDQEIMISRMVHRGVADHRAVIRHGRFLEYADPQILRTFFNRHPALFFDGGYWTDPYSALDYGSDKLTAAARDRVRARYDAYIADAAWLASQTPADLDQIDRDALIRATCSLRLLRPDTEE